MDKSDLKIDRVRYWGNVANFWIGVAFFFVGGAFYFFPAKAAKLWGNVGPIDPLFLETSIVPMGFALAVLGAALICVGELDRRRQLHGN